MSSRSPIFLWYGQVTSPDDESERILDPRLCEHQHTEQDDIQSSLSLLKSPRQANHSPTARKDKHKTLPKRTRKYTPYSTSPTSFDQSGPGDVRRLKFLERNRVAASKCRQKKKEWMQNLENRVRVLQSKNDSLRVCTESLGKECFYLKNQIMAHKNCECRAMQEFLDDLAREVVTQNNLPSRTVSGNEDHSRARSVTAQGPPDHASDMFSKVKEAASDEHALRRY